MGTANRIQAPVPPMRTVRDDEDRTYVLLKTSAESALVRDPATGEEQYRPMADLEPVEGESPLVAAARALPEPSEPPLDTIHDARALGLLCHLDANGPQPVMALLEIDTLCESDLHGATAELRAAGLVEETTVDGVRGYRVTDLGSERLANLRR